MKYIIFILLIIALIFFILSYEKRIHRLQHEIIILNRQINNLKSNRNRASKSSSLKIKFSTPTSSMGILEKNSNIYLAPAVTSDLINNISIKMEVSILDCATLNNDIWYYISLPIDSNINSRGWVKKENFSFFYGNSTSVTNN